MSPGDCPCCERSDWRPVTSPARRPYVSCRCCGFQRQDVTTAQAEARFLEQQQHYYGADTPTLETAHTRLDDEILTQRLTVVGRHLPRGASVLEAGPGSGRLACELAARGYPMTVVEESSALGTTLRQKGLTVYTGALEQLTFGEASFDAFCSFHVIEHVPDVLAHLSGGRRWVQPGGWAFIATPSADSWEHRMPRALSPNFDAAHLQLFSRRALALALDRTGWKLVALTTPEYTTAWLRVASKIVRRLRREDEEQTAGRYAAHVGGGVGAVVTATALVGRPWRGFQSLARRGNELFVVARAV